MRHHNLMLTSSSMDFALLLVALTSSLVLKRHSTFSARVGRSGLFAYLRDALLTKASKNCL